ncbi:USP domain-containing protein [Caenorhabditis elegans]|uniref:USP domain-containing protein n=1 Tax=Caenorhabditis elegans TaxID=6239 RepID=O17646_CAEEL|nr:USP domain-containing protein [Caenorhabditis elegans]CAB03946.1 USP domain-containing protein [Caenorhabditis elegans]|eukprot:NP_509876.1 Uncharacterized protein CELE_C34F6.9 [Caenorhabditis elegans]
MEGADPTQTVGEVLKRLHQKHLDGVSLTTLQRDDIHSIFPAVHVQHSIGQTSYDYQMTESYFTSRLSEVLTETHNLKAEEASKIVNGQYTKATPSSQFLSSIPSSMQEFVGKIGLPDPKTNAPAFYIDNLLANQLKSLKGIITKDSFNSEKSLASFSYADSFFLKMKGVHNNNEVASPDEKVQEKSSVSPVIPNEAVVSKMNEYLDETGSAKNLEAHVKPVSDPPASPGRVISSKMLSSRSNDENKLLENAVETLPTVLPQTDYAENEKFLNDIQVETNNSISDHTRQPSNEPVEKVSESAHDLTSQISQCTDLLKDHPESSETTSNTSAGVASATTDQTPPDVVADQKYNVTTPIDPSHIVLTSPHSEFDKKEESSEQIHNNNMENDALHNSTFPKQNDVVMLELFKASEISEVPLSILVVVPISEPSSVSTTDVSTTLDDALQDLPISQVVESSQNPVEEKTMSSETAVSLNLPCVNTLITEADEVKLRDALWEKRKREQEKLHNKTIIWSRTVTYPPIHTFPKTKKYVKQAAKIPQPAVLKEDPQAVKPRPPKKDVLAGYSVETIFLALTGETVLCRSHSLEDLVRLKQEELDAVTSILNNGVQKSQCDSGVMSNTLKSQDRKESEGVQLNSPLPENHAVNQTVNQSMIRKGRPKRSTKTKSGSETENESMSEDNDDFSEHDEDFDIEQAVQAIDNVHHKAKRERKSRSSITVSEDGYPPETVSPQELHSLKRKSLPDDNTTPSKQRRSSRLKNSTAKTADFVYEPAVTDRSEQDKSPSLPREKNIGKDSGKSRLASQRSSSRRSSAPFSEESPSTKKTRFSTRVEQYSRRVSNETIKSLLQQVLTPKAADECDIQDHFPSPIVRRAIVNRNTLCYAISMVQLLMRVPQVYSIVRSHSHKKQKANRSECFLCMLTNLISERPRADDTPAFVALLKSNWKNIEDEGMQCVMEAMQYFFNKFDEEYMHAHPPIRSYFEIEMFIAYECKSCKHVSNAPDKAIYVSIDLSSKTKGTMQSMVDKMANPIPVVGMNCKSCGQETLCSTTRFTKLPEVLLYFVPRVKDQQRGKDMTVLNVQRQLILKDDNNAHNYELCSFIAHCGKNGDNGHYKSFEVDRTNEFQYNEYDDAKVVLDSKLSSDITIVLAMFRKQEAVAKDAATDIIFDGRGNIVFANEKHCQSIQ